MMTIEEALAVRDRARLLVGESADRRYEAEVVTDDGKSFSVMVFYFWEFEEQFFSVAEYEEWVRKFEIRSIAQPVAG